MKQMTKAELAGYALAGAIGVIAHVSLLVWMISQ